jgi:hypothetical protein
VRTRRNNDEETVVAGLTLAHILLGCALADQATAPSSVRSGHPFAEKGSAIDAKTDHRSQHIVNRRRGSEVLAIVRAIHGREGESQR